MPISNYNTGFPQGVTIRNAPILDLQNGNGNVFWVDSNASNASDGNPGTFTFPLETLEKALELVKADQGDKIFLAAGHEETVEDATSDIVSVSGIQIIGLGTGDNRPHFIFTSTSSKFSVTADDVYIGNVYFSLNFGVPGDLLESSGNQFVLENCKFKDFGNAPINYLKIRGEDIKIINCDIESKVGTPEGGIVFYGPSYNTQIINCRVYGNFSEGCIYSPSGIGSQYIQRLFIDGGEYVNTHTTAFAMNFETQSSTGSISKSTTLRSGNPEKLNIYNAADFEIGQAEIGDIISVSTILQASSISPSGQILFTIRNGSFYLEDFVIDTDGDALGGATNLQLRSQGDFYGLVTFYEETVANLSISKSVSLGSASLIGEKRTFSNSTSLRLYSTGSALTGTNLKFTIVLRALENGSNIIKP